MLSNVIHNIKIKIRNDIITCSWTYNPIKADDKKKSNTIHNDKIKNQKKYKKYKRYYLYFDYEKAASY